MDKVYKHPRLGDVLLRQRWTTSRISLSVKPSGEVRLSYPRLVSTAKALRFLEEKVEWVLQMRSRAAERAMQGADYSAAQIEHPHGEVAHQGQQRQRGGCRQGAGIGLDGHWIYGCAR